MSWHGFLVLMDKCVLPIRHLVDALAYRYRTHQNCPRLMAEEANNHGLCNCPLVELLLAQLVPINSRSLEGHVAARLKAHAATTRNLYFSVGINARVPRNSHLHITCKIG